MIIYYTKQDYTELRVLFFGSSQGSGLVKIDLLRKVCGPALGHPGGHGTLPGLHRSGLRAFYNNNNNNKNDKDNNNDRENNGNNSGDNENNYNDDSNSQNDNSNIDK